MVIPETTHIQEILDRHIHKVQLRNTAHASLIESRSKILESLALDAAINNLDALLKTVDIQK